MNIFSHLIAKPFMGLAAGASLMMGSMVHAGTTTPTQVNASVVSKTTQEQKIRDKDMATPAAYFDAKGKVALFGAKVTSVSGTSLTAAETWGATTLSWAINAASTTISAKGTAVLPLSDIAVGDTVNVRGSLDTSAANTIDASLVRDISR